MRNAAIAMGLVVVLFIVFLLTGTRSPSVLQGASSEDQSSPATSDPDGWQEAIESDELAGRDSHFLANTAWNAARDLQAQTRVDCSTKRDLIDDGVRWAESPPSK